MRFLGPALRLTSSGGGPWQEASPHHVVVSCLWLTVTLSTPWGTGPPHATSPQTPHHLPAGTAHSCWERGVDGSHPHPHPLQKLHSVCLELSSVRLSPSPLS